jgi:hypothetical protein
MGTLARRPQTAGNRKRYKIDYSDWLHHGASVATAAVTLTDTNTVNGVLLTGATIDTVSVSPEGHVIFFVNGGVLNETFTATIQIVDSLGQIKLDTIDYFCVNP